MQAVRGDDGAWRTQLAGFSAHSCTGSSIPIAICTAWCRCGRLSPAVPRKSPQPGWICACPVHMGLASRRDTDGCTFRSEDAARLASCTRARLRFSDDEGIDPRQDKFLRARAAKSERFGHWRGGEAVRFVPNGVGLPRRSPHASGLVANTAPLGCVEQIRKRRGQRASHASDRCWPIAAATLSLQTARDFCGIQLCSVVHQSGKWRNGRPHAGRSMPGIGKPAGRELRK